MTSIGFYTLLLVGLKLSGYLLTPWWVVLSPLWGYVPVIIIAVVAANLFSKKIKNK